MKRNRILFNIFLLLSCLSACHESGQQASADGSLQLPDNKIWAHRVNDTASAREKEKQFNGMELDIVYSPYQNKLFVCHNEEDTVNGLTLDQWFAALKNPKKNGYWLDVKNLNYYTADGIATLVQETLDNYQIADQAFLESSSEKALKIVKEHGLHTSLWVDNFHWSSIDTADWGDKVSQQVRFAQPDALSCEYRMFGALTEYFSDQRIFLWHTPATLNEENAKITRELCQHPSVRVVLVDYDHPIPY